jgi:hypothetical protein
MAQEATTTTQTAAIDKEIEIPEWDNAAPKDGHGAMRVSGLGGGIGLGLGRRFDTVFPQHRRYLGLKRKTFLLVLLAVILALIGLIIGLAVGLTEHSK